MWQWLTEASDLPLFVHSCYANDGDGNELMLIITSVQMEMCQCGGGGGGKEQMITLNEWNDRTGSSLLIAPLQHH